MSARKQVSVWGVLGGRETVSGGVRTAFSRPPAPAVAKRPFSLRPVKVKAAPAGGRDRRRQGVQQEAVRALANHLAVEKLRAVF